jgi:hypothetical protein
MVKVALVVRLVAKAGKEEQVRAFLAGAEPQARAESFTPAWFALRTAKDVFPDPMSLDLAARWQRDPKELERQFGRM